VADKLSIIALLAAAVALGAPMLVLARSRPAARRALVALAILLAFALGELLLLRHLTVFGALLFILGAALFVLGRPWSWAEVEPSPPRGYHRLLMIALVIAAIGVGAGLRFWRLGDIPYGIEQDEMAWTVGAAHATYSDAYDEVNVQTYSFQRDLLPTSSFQERLFFDRFGMSLGTARLENAVFSTAAIVVFYLLVSRLAGGTTALIATLLLAISTLHIASARQAHVESHVLFWVVLSYLLFWLAVRQRSLALSLATGISMVLGLWTYETYNMTVAVIVGSFFLFAFSDRKRWRFHIQSMALLLLPLALITREEIRHAGARRSFQFSRFDAMRASLHGPIWERAWHILSYFGDNLRTLFENVFVRQTSPGFEFPMIRTAGPMVMAAVLPLAALGVLLILRAPARREHIFVLLWMALQLLTVPMVLGVGWGRVLLPGVLVLFVLAGTGGAFLLKRLASAYGRQSWVVAGTTLVLGVALVAVGARAYFYEVQDPEDRVIRREVVDTISAQRDTSAFVMIPSKSGQITPREGLLRPSAADMRFLLGKPPDLAAAEKRFRYANIDDLLKQVQSTHWTSGPLDILMPHRNQDPRLPVPPQEAGVRDCYDVKAISTGKYVDMLQITEESLANPDCDA
jgi:hypothetical protein